MSLRRDSRSRAIRLLQIVLFAGTALADTLTGEILGRVLDVQGGLPLEQATVTLVSSDRGWERRIQTSADGAFRFLQLEPGTYTVAAEREGYYRSERTRVSVRLNQPKVVLPPFELRRVVSTPTQQITTLQGEQTKTAIIDLTAPVPTSAILAVINEQGRTALASPGDAAMRFNFDARVTHSLPLRGGRSFDQLALLAPGVFRVPFAGGSGPAVGIGVGAPGQFSVNGMRGRSNNFTVDGSDSNDEDIGVRRQGFVTLVPQSNESIDEFQVMTAGFPAESGRNGGSMANAVSRSGARSFHGSAYGYFDDDHLNARGFFDQEFRDTSNAGSLNGGSWDGKHQRRAQYGGVIGGPLPGGSDFFFLSAERQDYEGATIGHFVVPRATQRGLRTREGFVPIGDLQEFLGSGGYPYSAEAGQGVFSLYPLPNNSSGPFGESTYSQSLRRHGGGVTASAKVDAYVSRMHSAMARYNFTEDDSVLPFTGEAINSSLSTDTRTQNVSLFLNSTTPGMANALRFSYGRTRLRFPAGKGSPLLFGSLPQGASISTPRIDTPYGSFGPFGATGPVGQIAIQPYSPVGPDVFNLPQGRVDNTYQASDFVTWTGRRHTLKAGFDLRRSQLNSFADRNARPLVLFADGRVSDSCQLDPFCPFATDDGLLRATDLASLGAPAGFLQTISTGPVPDSTIGLRFTQIDLFTQDEWRVKPGFTLQIGVRYELQTVPREVSGRIESSLGLTAEQFGHLVPAGSPEDQAIIRAGNKAFDDSLESLQRFVGGRTRIHEPDRNNLAPRFGFAWDLRGDGKSVIRGGYGLAYDANLGAVTSQSRNVFPTFAPTNLDLNFRASDGKALNSPVFFTFKPTQTPLIRPGTLNSYGLGSDAFATGLGTLFVQAPPLPGFSLSSNGLAFTLPEKHYRTAYSQQFILAAEHEVLQDVLVSMAYVGTRGIHLMRFSTPNGGLISTPILLSTPSRPLVVLDIPPIPRSSSENAQPGLGAYTVFEGSAASVFHSMQLSLEKRYSRGLQLRGGWTWAHAIDEVSDPFDWRGFFALPQDTTRLQQERASANFDVRHRVTAYFLWEPFRPANHGFARGWEVSGIVELQSGQPFTVNTSIDRNQDGNLTDRPDLLDVTAAPGAGNQIVARPDGVPASLLLAELGKNGRVGRNTLRARGIATVDLAVSRAFVLGDRTRLEARAEVFNAFNRTHFGIPIRILESPAFGRAYDTQVDPRSIRLSAKVVF